MMPLALYHYTTIGAFQGILDSESLRASSVFYLNDSAEFRLAQATAIEVLSSIVPFQSPHLVPYYRAYAHLLEHLTEVSSVFVFSLSTKRDDLSQWRAYGGDGSGVSLGFHFDLLRALLRASGHKLLRCVYEYPDQERRIRLFAALLAGRAFAASVAPDRAALDFVEAFLRFAPTLKDPAFASESEWRVVLGPPMTPGETQFFHTGTLLRPYRAFPFPLASFFTTIIGPTATPALTRLSITEFLRARGIVTTPERSNIPYRSRGA
jgi:hypothetical protein